VPYQSADPQQSTAEESTTIEPPPASDGSDTPDSAYNLPITTPDNARDIPISAPINVFDLMAFGVRMMLGAGLFAALGIATSEAGTWVVLSWIIAAIVAACCATSSVRLATNRQRNFPEVKITNHPFLGHLARWAGICGKVAASGVLILVIQQHLFPDSDAWLAAVIAGGVLGAHLLTTTNLPNLFITDENDPARPVVTLEDNKLADADQSFPQTSGTHTQAADTHLQAPDAPSPRLHNTPGPRPADIPSIVFNRFLVGFVLLVLTFVFFAAAASRQADLSNLSDGSSISWSIVPAAGLLFLTFGGYSWAAESSGRAKSSRQIMWATAGTLLLATITAITISLALLASAPATTLASSNSPFVTAADIGGFNRLSGLIRLTVAVACLGVLMPLLKSIRRDLKQFSTLAHHKTSPTSKTVSKVGLGLMAVSQISLVLFVGTHTLLTFAVFCLLIVGSTECVRALGLPQKPYKPPKPDTLENRLRNYNQLPPRTPTKRQQARLEARLNRPYNKSQKNAEVVVRIAAVAGAAGCLLLAFSLPLTNVLIASGVLAAGTVFAWTYKALKPHFSNPQT